MSSPTSSVQVSINGGAWSSGLVLAAFGQTVNFRQNPAAGGGILSQVWELFDGPPDLLASLPAGWTLQNGIWTTGGAAPATVTWPASGANAWGSLGIRQRLNGNPEQYDDTGALEEGFVSTLTDESTIVIVPDPVFGFYGLAAGETTQVDAYRNWVGAWMHDLRLISSSGSPTLRKSTTGPSVSVAGGVSSVILTGAGPLTDMTGGVAGQRVVVTIQSAAAAVNRGGSAGSKFLLSGSSNCVATNGYSTLEVIYEPLAGGGTGAWMEISRSTANG